MTNLPDASPGRKNPDGLAGRTGVGIDLAGQQERREAYTGRTPRLSGFGLTAWAAACDSMFDCAERTARIVDAYRVLAELVPDHEDYPDQWLLRVVQP